MALWMNCRDTRAAGRSIKGSSQQILMIDCPVLGTTVSVANSGMLGLRPTGYKHGPSSSQPLLPH